MPHSTLENYDEDFQLKHVVLSDIWFYDPEYKKYVPAKLELFGHCSFLLTYNNGKPDKPVRMASAKTEEMDYKITSYDGGLVTLELAGDDQYRLQVADFK